VKRTSRLAALFVGALLLASACSSAATTAPTAAPATGAPATAAPATAAPMTEAPTAAATEAAACTAPSDPLGVVTIPPDEPVHMAFWGVLSGADATLGTDSQYGVEIAIDDHGGKVLGHDVRLTTEDGLCTPEGGATAAQKLAADPTIVGLVGSSCSDETVGGIKAITEAGLTTISPSNTRPVLTDPNRDATYAGYLRTAHSDSFQGKAAAEFVYNELKLTKAATIHDGSSYAQALQQVFADEFTKLGGTITIQEAVSKGQTDMKPVLTRVAATNPEFIYYPIFVAEGGFITKQLKEVPGLENVKHMSADGTFSPDFVKAAGAAALGHYLSSPDFSKFGAAAYAAFKEKYKAKFGKDVLSIFHAHAYDAATILLNTLDKVTVKCDDGTLYVPKGALRDALYQTKDFQGLTGTLSCSPSGDCGAPVIAVYEVTQREVDGKWPPEAPIWPK
jgi:branched-chain amino acid transport system substrate-binding protein